MYVCVCVCICVCICVRSTHVSAREVFFKSLGEDVLAKALHNLACVLPPPQRIPDCANGIISDTLLGGALLVCCFARLAWIAPGALIVLGRWLGQSDEPTMERAQSRKVLGDHDDAPVGVGKGALLKRPVSVCGREGHDLVARDGPRRAILSLLDTKHHHDDHDTNVSERPKVIVAAVPAVHVEDRGRDHVRNKAADEEVVEVDDAVVVDGLEQVEGDGPKLGHPLGRLLRLGRTRRSHGNDPQAVARVKDEAHDDVLYEPCWDLVVAGVARWDALVEHLDERRGRERSDSVGGLVEGFWAERIGAHAVNGGQVRIEDVVESCQATSNLALFVVCVVVVVVVGVRR